MGFILGTARMVQHMKINVTHQINKMKEKNHMIISIGGEKAFEKILHLFILYELNRLGIERMHLNIMKAIYDKPMANILNGERLKAFPPRS